MIDSKIGLVSVVSGNLDPDLSRPPTNNYLIKVKKCINTKIDLIYIAPDSHYTHIRQLIGRIG